MGGHDMGGHGHDMGGHEDVGQHMSHMGHMGQVEDVGEEDCHHHHPGLLNPAQKTGLRRPRAPPNMTGMGVIDDPLITAPGLNAADIHGVMSVHDAMLMAPVVTLNGTSPTDYLQMKMNGNGGDAGGPSGLPPLPEWPPAGSIGSGGMGLSPLMKGALMGTSPMYGKSVDMVDVCTQLMGSSLKDPLSDLGSLRNELIAPPFSFTTKEHDPDDELNEEMMILGTTPNFSAPNSAMTNFQGQRRPSNGPNAMNGFHLGQADIPDFDDLMGMSPDLPSMLRSPNIGSAGFESFMKKYQGPGGLGSGPIALAQQQQEQHASAVQGPVVVAPAGWGEEEGGQLGVDTLAVEGV